MTRALTDTRVQRAKEVVKLGLELGSHMEALRASEQW